IRDNFFDLGGDSILSIRIIAKARNEGLDFSLRQLFECNTIEHLAKVVTLLSTEQIGNSSARSRELIVHRKQEKGPLSFLQEQLLFLQEYAEEKWLYNIPVLLRLKGRIDLGALEEAFQEIVQRHEVLRTRIGI